MPKPLRSSEPGQPKDLQFAHFGVLDSGSQSKGSLLTAVITNVLLALIAIILGAAVHKVIKPKETVSLVVPLAEKPPEPIKPKVIPPKMIPPKLIPKPVEPKIKLPDVKVIEPPQPVAVNIPKPMPVITPAPPKAVVAAAAPKPVAVNLAQSASVVNHDAHPSAVALGHPDNPIHPSDRPATSSVNLGQRGQPGMPSSNSGGGPSSTKVSLGSGQPNGSIGGTGSRAGRRRQARRDRRDSGRHGQRRGHASNAGCAWQHASSSPNPDEPCNQVGCEPSAPGNLQAQANLHRRGDSEAC